MRWPWENRARRDGAGAPVAEIVLDGAGLEIIGSTGPAANPIDRLTWAAVTRVTAYKRDLFAVDLVCLLFETADGRRIEVDEECGAWDRLLETLPSVLPGALDRDRILRAVVLPAFATNETVVFERT
jgi:hypothetical protein